MTFNATQVFTPTDFPALTYVVRGEDRFEEKLRGALEVPKQIISISGPSKSGKTALVVRVVGSEYLIKVSGIEIRNPGDLWQRVLDWMEAPNSISTTLTTTNTVGARGGFSAARVSAEASVMSASADARNETRTRAGLPEVCREIADSDFVVFLDDFHYMPTNIQVEVAREIKTAAERNVKICVASVPHRSDDIVRSNHELRGRTVNIDTKFWTINELGEIGKIGFPKMNMRVSDTQIGELAEQACGSPQLMQSICLDVCRVLDVRRTAMGVVDVNLTTQQVRNILEDTASRTNFESLVRDLHQGPRSKGQPRDKFRLIDGTTGDAYRCLLLALQRDPPRFQISYADLVERVRRVCSESGPIGSSIQNACRQITRIAVDNSPSQRIVEWDERAGSGTLSVVDPYFLFYIRHSNKLQELGQA